MLLFEDRPALWISELLAIQPGTKAICLGSQGVIVVEKFKLVPVEDSNPISRCDHDGLVKA